MKLAKIMPLLLLTVFFLVEYESYTWNPCAGVTCLAICCGEDCMGPCTNPAYQFFVKTIEEVRELVKKNGTEHLSGMYRIDYDSNNKSADVIELELVPDFTIVEPREELNTGHLGVPSDTLDNVELTWP